MEMLRYEELNSELKFMLDEEKDIIKKIEWLQKKLHSITIDVTEKREELQVEINSLIECGFLTPLN